MSAANGSEAAAVERPVLRIYDPALCCSTGVCGPEVDDGLVRFAADVAWLIAQGVPVERYNLAQEPGAFVANPSVRRALQERGTGCLPLLLWGTATVAEGSYPDRRTLTGALGLVAGAGDGGGA
jgi:hypothetical protein